MSRTLPSRAEVIVVGAGLAGLAAAAEVGPRAITLERDSRPGGLVRTQHTGDGYWFDSVLHLLYCPDTETENFVRELLGDCLVACFPEAWVCTAQGTVRYPLQMHLGGLPSEVVVRCLSDLATVSFEQNTQPADNFETMLRATFGKEMCEVFLHPYNRKMWKRPLTELAPAGFQWTITKPVFDEVVRGALQGDRSFRAYNSNGWYPRPPRGATLRGMEVLSAALAKQAADLRLAHSVIGIDIGRREVHCLNASGELSFGYERAVCCTLPLQRLLGLVQPLPERLRTLHQDLKWNRVVMAAFRVRGPRPEGRGHWRYYSDESLLFNRLIYMHEFDPDTAPADGWSVMAEITEPHEWPMRNREELLTECLRDIVRTGEFPNGCEVIGQDCWAIDPAYVVFTAESQRAVEEITAYLREHDVEPLGRYGRWEYSSMGQVIRDGRRWARELIGTNEAQGGTKS